MALTRNNQLSLPCVATRDFIVLPHMSLKFDVMRPKSVAALREALMSDRLVFMTAQKDINVSDPTENDVYKVGTVCEIKQIINLSEGASRVRVEGLYRAKLLEYSDDGISLHAVVRPMKNYGKDKITDEELDAFCRVVKAAFEA